MLSTKLSMSLLLVAAALAPIIRSCHLTRDENDPLDSYYFLHDTFSSILHLQNLERSLGGRELPGNEINPGTLARLHNLKPANAIERRNNAAPIYTVQLTYHKATLSTDKDTWTAEVSIGSNTRPYHILFSTGSSDFWVTTTRDGIEKFSSYPGCKNKNIYVAHLHASGKKNHRPNDEVLQGEFVPQHNVEGLFENRIPGEKLPPKRRDTVKVGDITVEGHIFGTIKLVWATAYFCRLQFDGILGLAFPALAVDRLDPFLIAAKQSGFAFYLTKDSGSVLHIGGTDPRYTDKDIEYHDILRLADGGLRLSYWAIGNGKIKVGDKIVASGISTIIDSGTDMIFGPTSIVSNIYAAIPFGDATSHVFPCRLPAQQFPKISFSWGDGKEWTIDRESFILDLDDHPDDLPSHDYWEAKCHGVIQKFGPLPESDAPFRGKSAIEASDPESTTQPFVLGTRFLTSLYSVFDIKGKRIGFAPLKQKGTSPSSGPPKGTTKRQQNRGPQLKTKKSKN